MFVASDIVNRPVRIEKHSLFKCTGYAVLYVSLLPLRWNITHSNIQGSWTNTQNLVKYAELVDTIYNLLHFVLVYNLIESRDGWMDGGK